LLQEKKVSTARGKEKTRSVRTGFFESDERWELATPTADKMSTKPRRAQSEQCVGRWFRNHTNVIEADRCGVATSGPKRDKN
jgi:hypothetical protein